jgi:subtilisin family serine protease
MSRRFAVLSVAGLLALGACAEDATEPTTLEPSSPSLADAKSSAPVGINVVLKARGTQAQIARLNAIGRVKSFLPEINGLTMEARANQLRDVRALPFVKAAAIDQEVLIPPPTDLVPVEDFTGGFSTWNQDAVNATLQPLSSARDVTQTGEGVYVGVLDTGLLSTWPQYFPQERIAEEYAATVVGGGAADRGRVVVLRGEQWANDVCAHGTHVTSTILGYRFPGANFQGTAPEATVIPVRFKARHSSNTRPFGCSWYGSQSAAGLIYYGVLKRDELGSAPLVVNNSWGSSVADPLVEAAVNFALAQGVLLVASAGNAGEAGMGYPGAWSQVISAAASGWIREWTTPTWWFGLDVPEPTVAGDFYITDFSSREETGQDLDVAAPGSWVVGPFQLQRGQTSWFFLGGTSMSAPHVTGTVALLLEENPSLTQAQAEAILENTAIPIGPGCRSVILVPGGTTPEEICWGADATGSGLLDAEAAVAAAP